MFIVKLIMFQIEMPQYLSIFIYVSAHVSIQCTDGSFLLSFFSEHMFLENQLSPMHSIVQ